MSSLDVAGGVSLLANCSGKCVAIEACMEACVSVYLHVQGNRFLEGEEESVDSDSETPNVDPMGEDMMQVGNES